MDYTFTNELAEVFERAEELFKTINVRDLSDSVLFLAILSTPSCDAYKSLEDEGRNIQDLYEFLYKNVKKREEPLMFEDNVICMGDKLNLYLGKAYHHALSAGKEIISSKDLLYFMKEDMTSSTSKILANKNLKSGSKKSTISLSEEKAISYKVEIPKLLYDFGKNLNELATGSNLDPVSARDKEIFRMINILERRTKNNPCLIGDPGVGKTSIVEGLAQKIVSGEVPEQLKNKTIFALDIPSIVAGCKYRGDFEARFKSIIQETIKAKNIILFIDEIHLIIGAGGEENAIDASNILKPYIGKGELKIIGATTTLEYKKRIEKDPALERRLQQIIIEEPSIDEAIQMLTTTKLKYEQYHSVVIEDQAIVDAVNLSSRYISGKFLPDKAIDLLDESCVVAKLATADKIVTSDIVAFILSQWTGVPVTKLTEDESTKLINFEDILHKDIIGQDDAINVISSYIRRSRVGLNDPQKPIGSFLFAGPSGVGKTYLCKIIAKTLFNDENAIIRLDMSEYMENHSVSKLIGSPPGYIGFDDGGQLTDRVKKHPYSIVLFDEIEKASSDVFNLLLQILDDGRLTDSKGATVNFKNTIIVMTSNLGSDMGPILSKKGQFGFSSCATEKTNVLDDNVKAAIKEKFKPEFINRIDEIVIFHPLEKDDVKKILDIIINSFNRKINNYNIKFSDSSIEYLIENGYNKEYGARPLKRIFQDKIENPLALKIISKDILPEDKVLVDIEDKLIVFRKE